MTVQERNRSILEHILKYCDQIDATVERFGRGQQAFESDVVYQNAVALCLLQIGELVGHLSDDFKASRPQIPWRQIKALRNIIAHNYASIDAETAWEIVETDISVIRAFCADELYGPSKQ